MRANSYMRCTSATEHWVALYWFYGSIITRSIAHAFVFVISYFVCFSSIITHFFQFILSFYVFIFTFIYAFSQSVIQLLTYLYYSSFIYSFVLYLFIYSFIHLLHLIYRFIIHSAIHPCVCRVKKTWITFSKPAIVRHSTAFRLRCFLSFTCMNIKT